MKIIEESRLVTDIAEVQTQRTEKSTPQINILNTTLIPPRRGKESGIQMIIKEKKRDDVKMKSTESLKGALC